MTRSVESFMRSWLGAATLAAASLAMVGTASAQPVVQPLPDPAVARLNQALRVLAGDPQYLPALIDAGRASLALEDPDSALGFFRRAQAVAPDDGRVKAGLAAVMVRQAQPLEALRLFAEAEQAGEPMNLHAAERGLAYDLIGDNARAQQDYLASLAFAPDPAVSRRLALSQAIAGDQRASEATLLPLLQRSDLAAYRTRAFALAILGKSDEAVSIAETMLPTRLSSRLAPYLRYMPRLTRAQQAAAANLGVFPPAAQIGRDDPAVAAYAAQLGVPQTAAPRSADARLVPAGEPLGRRDDSRIPRREDNPRLASATATSLPETRQEPVPAEPALQLVEAAVAPAELPAVGAAMATPVTAETAIPAPSLSLTEDAPPEARDLSEAFADFSLPAGSAARSPDAVDITSIQPRREVAEPPRPAPPVHPSRHWVQVATGRDTSALAFDWRRVRREAGGLLDKAAPHVARWGQTNRLVAGPFASAREADALVASLKEKDIDSFRFTSASGEEVKPLG